jgi:hypothetical protein
MLGGLASDLLLGGSHYGMTATEQAQEKPKLSPHAQNTLAFIQHKSPDYKPPIGAVDVKKVSTEHGGLGVKKIWITWHMADGSEISQTRGKSVPARHGERLGGRPRASMRSGKARDSGLPSRVWG